MFEVWAPLAGRVALQLDGVRHPMEPGGGGWWQLHERRTAAAIDASAEHDYGYLLDSDETVLPDPRSRHQPDTVHGLSRTFDAKRFSWSDQGWTGRQLAGGVIYELHLGTFTPDGTADSAIARLDHLVALGIDFVELLPVNAFEGPHNWGYDGVAWYAVDESYGGPAGYLRLVDACHRHGLGVIQDVVYNHLGPSGNYLPRFGPYLHASAANTWGASLNFDQPQVRSYVIDNALMWLREYHVDGLRLDAVHALVDESAKHILQELAEETDAASASIGRPLSLIAESDLNDPVIIRPREAGGYGMTAQWSDDFHHAVHVALTGETAGYYADFASPAALPTVLTRGFFHAGTYSSFRGRPHGRPIDVERMPAWRLVAYDQNHDQIGNRAAGDRLSAVLDEGQLGIAAVLTLTSPFTPMLFMGEEWGASTPWQYFTAFTNAELGAATARGRLAEFARMGWDPTVVPDPQARSTFERSKLDWSELADDAHARLLELYRALIRLRRSLPDLTDPRLDRVECEVDEAEQWLIVHRGGSLIVVNFAGDARRLPVTGTMLLATDAAARTDANETALPGHSAAVLASRAEADASGYRE